MGRSDFTRAIRAHWHECPTCAAMYGGNGTKVAPGETCLNCGWDAPGERGDDMRAAGFESEKEKRARWRQAVADKAFMRCNDCGASFIDFDTLIDHEIKRHPKLTSDDDWSVF